MGKVLVISEIYLIDKSADTNCMRSVLNGLTEQGHEVTLLAREYSGYYRRKEKFNVVYVYQKSQELIDKLLFVKGKNRIVTSFCHILGHLIVRLNLDQHRTQKAYNKEYKKAQSEGKPYDCILSFYRPVKNNAMAELMVKKNKGAKWFMYFWDPHTYNYTYTDKRIDSTVKRRAANEMRWAKHAYGVISSYGILEENERHNFYPYKNLKNLEVHLPNLNLHPDSKVTIPQTSDKPKMVYTGQFYKDIRNPDFLIQILNELNPQFVSAEFYGNACEYLKEQYDNLPECVSLKGSVSQFQIPELLNNSDILINVGNTTVNQVPSKVFDYISTGRPILNVYFNDNDSSLFYLKKYPSVLNIKVGSQINISEIEEFIKSAKPVPYDQLYDIYKDYTLDTTLQKIIEFLELQ